MKRLFVIYLVLCASITSFAQATDIVVDCQNPGWLSNMISYSDQQTVRNLKVTGFVNKDDLKFIGTLVTNRSLNGILDLGEVSIVGETSEKDNCFDGRYILPAYPYDDIKPTLEKFICPQSATSTIAVGSGFKSIGTVIYDCNVSTLKSNAFHYNPTVGVLILGEHITTIEKVDCQLESVQFPSSLTSIEESAFYNKLVDASSTNLDYFPSLKYLGNFAFVNDTSNYPSNKETLPDSIFLPQIKDFYVTAFDYREGMHVFLGEEITDFRFKRNQVYSFANIFFHFKSPTPPNIRVESTYNGSMFLPYGLTLCVPRGSKGNYEKILDDIWPMQPKYYTVIEEDATIQKIFLEPKEFILPIGEKRKVNVSFMPEDVVNKSVIWESDNKDVAIVDSTGMVTAISSGVANIFAMSSDRLTRDTCKVTVFANNILTIKATGGGVATFNDNMIREESKTLSVAHGSSATVTFMPDAGYRIKSVKLNNIDVTANVKDNRYTISSISGDTSLEVEFEAIPYTLTIKSTGNGEVSYNGTAIRGKSSTFTVTYGSSASVAFMPDAGYRIKSVKLNNDDVTTNVIDNRYTIGSISGDASLEVEFEAIPYTLTIKSTGNGEASYNGTAIRGKSSTFTITYGSSATISFNPDAGYRIKSVKLNNEDITANVTDSQYTIGNIMADMVVEVLFEVIPDYILNIVATGNGNVGYEGIVIRNQSHSYTLREGSSAVLSLSPDAGYRLASVKVNGTEAMGQVTSGKLIIGNITVNTTVEVVFEIIPPTTYMLVVRAEGNGMVAFDGVFVRNSSQTFTVVEGEYATLEISADENNRLKRVSVDGIDVTPNVMNGKYIINDIKANTAVEVLFEKIPIYTLSVTAKGNGVATCNGTEIRNNTNTFSLYEGTSVTVSFTADTGYRVKSVKLNGADVTAAISDGQYTINGITTDTTIEVEFERITYALTIEVVGNGSVVFDGVAIRGASKTFYVEEGNTATFTYAADDGFRLKGITMDGSTSVTDSGQYAIESIMKNTTVMVEFEAIPTYALNIVAAGYGNVNYDNKVIRNQSQSYSVREGSTVVLTCEPDAGYRLASVKVNDTDVMGEIADGKLTIGNIAANTTVNVVFEAIPPTTYSLTITSAGNGSASYDGGTVRDGSKTFTVVEGAYATVVFTPDDGYHVKSVIVNGVDVSSNVFDNRYTVSKITANSTLEVDFEEDIKELTKDGLRYAVVSYADQTVNLASGEYGTVLTVPATFTANGKEWKVVGAETDALKDNQELAAIIWNPGAAFNGSVGNPNLLLYVKQKEFASPTVQNVIVDGVAENIVLTDAAIGNNFYCPKAFTAKQISYEHNYSMKSGYNTCEGWETLVLPFDVTKITRQSVTELVPHSVWTVGSSQRPFWLYSLTEIGWRPETAIAANTPYIISMPNNENYAQDYNLSGYIQFVGVDVQVKTSDNLPVGKNGQKRMVPNYQYRPTDSNVYALNVDNMYSQNASGSNLPGSTFVSGSRAVHPFEAYLTLEGANARNAIPLFENGTTGINTLLLSEGMTVDDVYNLNGQRISIPRKGLYIVKGMKVVVK